SGQGVVHHGDSPGVADGPAVLASHQLDAPVMSQGGSNAPGSEHRTPVGVGKVRVEPGSVLGVLGRVVDPTLGVSLVGYSLSSLLWSHFLASLTGSSSTV